MLLVRRHEASAKQESHPRETAAAPPERVDPSALTDLPSTARGAGASRAALAAQLQRTHGNQAVQSIARKVRVEREEAAGTHDSSDLRPFLDDLGRFIDANYKGQKMKRGVLDLIHDTQTTYVFDTLHLVVAYMAADDKDPSFYRLAAATPAPAAAAQGPQVAMQAFAFPSNRLKGIKTHLGVEVKRSGGKNHTITAQDHEDMLARLTVNSLSAERDETEVARHDFQNFGSREKDDFCNYQVQIGGSDLYYKRKDTSFSAVIVDKRLLDGDPGALLNRVKEMHRESFTSLQNVILTTNDEAGAAFIKRHARE